MTRIAVVLAAIALMAACGDNRASTTDEGEGAFCDAVTAYDDALKAMDLPTGEPIDQDRARELDALEAARRRAIRAAPDELMAAIDAIENNELLRGTQSDIDKYEAATAKVDAYTQRHCGIVTPL